MLPILGLLLLAPSLAPLSAGETGEVAFTLPFSAARAKALREGKLLFLKPIYGGVDRAGALDYREGSW